MNFSKLTSRALLLTEAKGRFDDMFQTIRLRKTIEDKKLGVARPLVYKFILQFLADKGMVPEGTKFAPARYAAEVGQFLQGLVDSGALKNEIASEFGDYIDKKLPDFVKIQQLAKTRGKGEMIGKTFGGKEEQEKYAAVKSKEEYEAARKAAREAKKETKQAEEPVTDEKAWEFAKPEIKARFLAAVEDMEEGTNDALNKKLLGIVDSSTNEGDFIDKFYSYIDSIPEFTFNKFTEVFKVLQNVAKTTVAGHVEPAERREKERSTFGKRTGLDTGGLSMGSAGQPEHYGYEDEEYTGGDVGRHCPGCGADFSAGEKCTCDEDEPVATEYSTGERRHKSDFQESHKVKYVTSRERFKPKNIWQQVQQQRDRFYL